MTSRTLIERRFSPTEDQVCSEGAGGMVAAAHPAAASAGVSMLKKGGNAVDAAVATALALCVCEPQACSLGGQSYAIFHLDGRASFLDGSGRVPLRFDGSGLDEEDILLGYKGTSVPTTPLVLACMQKRFGSLSWSEVLKPAIEIAEDGYEITSLQHALQKRELQNFATISNSSGSRYFLKDADTPHRQGDVFVQPELASLLKRLAQHGVEDFYTGKTARRIAEDIRANGGFLSEEDLRAIPWPHERPLIEQRVFSHTILASPPPTQGRLLVHNLKVAEEMARRGKDLLGDDVMPLFADLFHNSYQTRLEQSPHPDLYSWFSDDIFSRENVSNMAGQILGRLNGYRENIAVTELVGGETTHLSVMDRDGNCAGITQSVNMVYGAKAAAEGLGFLYNNYLIDSFSLPAGHPHALVAGRTAPCSVAPFILLGDDGLPWLVGGSPGSQRIVTALTLFLVRMLYGGMPMDQAMRQPRYHCQDFREVILEEGRFTTEQGDRLLKEGYRVGYCPPFYFGAVHAVLKRDNSERYQGVAEMRRDGVASAVQ